MASYSASMIVKGVMTDKLMTACGSFGNISIDGRLSMHSACEVAREHLKKEAAFKKSEYLGFIIEKTNRFVDYRNPKVVDNSAKAAEISF